MASLPFLNAFYVDVPNRFYGMAISDLLEGEQRFQQAAINASIDELSLTINAPFAKKRGVSLTGGSSPNGPWAKSSNSKTPKTTW
jgi:hypothetical protein